MADFTPGYLKDVFLSSVKAGLINMGVQNPNTGPGSYYDLLGTALEDMGASIYYPALQATNDLMPDTAVGEALDRIAISRGTSRRPASQSSGYVVFAGTYPTAIAIGARLKASNGIDFEVSQGGTYAPAALIPIRSITGGTGANLTSGKLKWAQPPPYSAAEVSIAGGTAGGVNAEDDETLRGRVLELIANPPAGGNWSHVNLLAESIDAAIQKAFTYPAALGPSTARVVVVAAPGPSNKTRQIDPFLLSNKIAPSVSGYLPGGNKIITTSVVDVPTNIAIALAMDGWLDNAVFPYIDGYNFQASRIPVVNVDGSIVVQSQRAPIVGGSRMSWIDRANGWQVKTSTVISSNVYSPNQYLIKLDNPFIGVAIGDFVFPASANAQNYLDSILAYFATMGPGEITNNYALAEFAMRKPRPQQSYSMNIDTNLLGKLERDNADIIRAQYMHRSMGNYALNNNVLVPALPPTPNDAPRIFIPKNIGFYALGDI